MKDPKRLALYQAYLAVSPLVWEDIKRFCRYDASLLVQSMLDGKLDRDFTLINAGKREVFVHVMNRLREPVDIPEEKGIDT